MADSKGPRYPVNPITAERIRALRHQNKETQEQLARALGYEDKQATARWENQKIGVSEDTLLCMARHWGVVPEYLTGETDIKNPLEYYASCEQAADEGMREYYEEERAERARLENLFAKCGFRYSDISHTAAFDFDPATKGPHLLSDMQGGVPDAAMSSQELGSLLENLHDVIAFECFKKSRKEVGDNGTDCQADK